MDTIRDSWLLPCIASPMITLQLKLKRLRYTLKKWNWEVFGNLHTNINCAKQPLEIAEANFETSSSVENGNILDECKKIYELELEREELFCRDKSRQKWLEAGDKNTQFFFASVKGRGTTCLNIHSGDDLVDDPSELKNMAIPHFSSLFSENKEIRDCSFLDHIKQLVDEQANHKLMARPSGEEIKETMMKMDADSASGPDGFSGLFYQKCRSIISEDVIDAVSEFFEGKSMPRSYTATSLTLIPKVNDPKSFEDVRTHPSL